MLSAIYPVGKSIGLVFGECQYFGHVMYSVRRSPIPPAEKPPEPACPNCPLGHALERHVSLDKSCEISGPGCNYSNANAKQDNRNSQFQELASNKLFETSVYKGFVC